MARGFYLEAADMHTDDWYPVNQTNGMPRDMVTQADPENVDTLFDLLHVTFFDTREFIIRYAAEYVMVDLSILMRIRKDSAFRLDPEKKKDSEIIYRLARFFYPSTEQKRRLGAYKVLTSDFDDGYRSVYIEEILSALRETQKREWEAKVDDSDVQRWEYGDRDFLERSVDARYGHP